MNRRRHERKALGHLDDAFQKSDGALDPAWVEDEPALAAVRGGADWALVMERHRRKPVSDDQLPEFEERTAIRGYPERPWGDPLPRMRGWLAAAAVLLLVLAILLPGWGPAELAVLLVAAFALWRARLAYREASRTRATERIRRRRAGA